MLNTKNAEERASYMRINPLKDQKGEESVTLSIAGPPQFHKIKDREVIKLKLDEGTK